MTDGGVYQLVCVSMWMDAASAVVGAMAVAGAAVGLQQLLLKLN